MIDGDSLPPANPSGLHSDPMVYRMIVAFMGIGLLLCLGGVCVISVLGREIPTTLGTVAGTLVGAMSTMLYTSVGRSSTNGRPNDRRIVVP